jgi:hypothetical protein
MVTFTEKQVEETDNFFVTEKHFDDGFVTKVLTPKFKMCDSELELCKEVYSKRKYSLEGGALEPKAKAKALKELKSGYQACICFISHMLTQKRKQREIFYSAT